MANESRSKVASVGGLTFFVSLAASKFECQCQQGRGRGVAVAKDENRV